MKFIIFADKSYNYVKPISNGLNDTLLDLGHETQIYYDGIHWLEKQNLFKVLISDIGKFCKNIIKRKSKLYIYRFWNLLTFENKKFKKHINECDAIIIVYNCPIVFYKESLSRIEELREKYNKPILLYDFHFLPNQGWYKIILEKNANNFGLERFDAYLLISIVTEFAIPKEIPEIYHLIGMDIHSKDLYPEQTDFTVLLDFARKGKEKERFLVKQALSELGIKYVELSGRYTTEEIRKLYRHTDIYFPSTRESFGLPVVEIQLCGGIICVPHESWLPAHFLDKDIYSEGIGHLGQNFLCYNNSKEKLKELITNIKAHGVDHKKVINNFEREYSLYSYIDKDMLNKCLNKLETGEINEYTHLAYEKYNKYISLKDDYTSK